MANTVVGFTINIDGINTVQQLNDAIKQTKKELNGIAVGTEEYANKSRDLANLVKEQKKVRDAQKDLNKEIQSTAKDIGAYDQLSAKLQKIRKDYKNMAAAGQDNTEEAKALKNEIQRLDTQLKNIDGSVGQFQRNVGNYPKGIGRIIKQLEGVVPQLQGITSQLQKTDGSLSLFGKALIGGFLAFQAGKYIVRAIEELNKLSEEFIATSNTIQEFSNLSGQALEDTAVQVTALATTFDTDAESISRAASSLAMSLGIGFNEALGMVEEGLLNSTVSAEEFLSTVEETPEIIDDLIGKTSDYAGAQRQVLEANKELAKAQADLAKEFGSVGQGLEAFGTRLKAGLIAALVTLLKIFKPVGAAFASLGAAFARLIGYTEESKEGFSFLQGALNTLLVPFRLIGFVLEKVVQGITLLIDGFTYLRKEVPIVGKVFDGIAFVMNGLSEVFNNLPFVFAGVVAALKQLGTNIANFFKTTAIDADIFANQVANSFGGNFDAYIERRRKDRDALLAESKTVGQAFSEAFNKAKQEADEKAAAEERRLAKIEADKAKVQQKQIDSEALAERRKAQAEAYKKLLEDRRKFLDEERKFIDQQLAIQVKLQERANELLIKGIVDVQERAIREERAALQKRIASAENDLQKLVELAQAREDEAIKLFGLNAKETIKIREDAAKQIAQAEAVLNDIRVRETLATEEKIKSIQDKFIAEQTKQRTAQFNERLKTIKDFADSEAMFLEEQRVRDLISEQDYQEQLLQLTLNRIDAEIEAQKAQLALNKQLAEQGIQIAEGENEAIARSINQLNLDRFKAEKSFTDFSKSESDKRQQQIEDELQKERDARVKVVEKIAETFAQVSDLFSQVFDVASELRLKRIEQEEQANQAGIDRANERIQNTTGLEREFYENQLSEYQQNLEKFGKLRENEARKQAIKDKAIAAGESIINTALAVTKALASAPPPINVGLAIAAGAAGAVQTGVILAQPFAQGGRVGGGNIPRQPNGDNVLATVKTGEVVLTERQQSMLGGSGVFRAIGVKGFASGGVVGAPTSILNQTTEGLADAKDRANSVNAAINAINARFDRIEVVWTPNSQLGQDNGLKDRKEIKNNTQF